VPLHFTAFHPDWKMRDILPPTPPATLSNGRDAIALEAGLHYVYTGNVHDSEGGTTFCPDLPCGPGGARLVRDSRLSPHRQRATARIAVTAIAGRFEQYGGAFGARRIPVSMAAS
jgi:pyruvate formate lyase activating enzyme